MKRREFRPIEDPALVEGAVAAVRSRDPFSEVDAPLVTELVRSGALVEIEAGEALIREGEAATPEFYVLVEGALNVQSKTGFIARLERPGDVIGEVAVLLSSKRTADVIAAKPVRVVAIPSRALELPQFAEIAAGIRRVMLRDDWMKY